MSTAYGLEFALEVYHCVKHLAANGQVITTDQISTAIAPETKDHRLRLNLKKRIRKVVYQLERSGQVAIDRVPSPSLKTMQLNITLRP